MLLKICITSVLYFCLFKFAAHSLSIRLIEAAFIGGEVIGVVNTLITRHYVSKLILGSIGGLDGFLIVNKVLILLISFYAVGVMYGVSVSFSYVAGFFVFFPLMIAINH